jgi:hypothetical protein
MQTTSLSEFGKFLCLQVSMPGGSRVLQRYMGHINVQTGMCVRVCACVCVCVNVCVFM